MDTPTSQPYTPTPAPAPMTPPVSPAPMHPHHRSPVVPVLIGGVVVLLLVVAANATGIWPFSKSETAMVSPSPSVSAQPSMSVSPTAIPDPTAGWKTYTNTQYGFEVKYPSDWSQSISTSNSQITQFGPAGTLLVGIRLGSKDSCQGEREFVSVGNVQREKCYTDRPAGEWFVSLSDTASFYCWSSGECDQILSTFKFTQ